MCVCVCGALARFTVSVSVSQDTLTPRCVEQDTDLRHMCTCPSQLDVGGVMERGRAFYAVLPLHAGPVNRNACLRVRFHVFSVH